MRNNKLIALGGAVALLALAGHDAVPSEKVAKYDYDLEAVQADDVTTGDPQGTTKIMTLPNGNVKVQFEATGLVPGVPHAAHLHDVLGEGTSECPGPEDAGDDGIVSVLDGVGSYGGVQVSLTTTGEFSAAQALDVADMPVADDDGRLAYTRQFPADFEVADDGTTIGDIAGTAQVVLHGIDNDGDGYDTTVEEDGPSSLSATTPIELTAPVLCGGTPLN